MKEPMGIIIAALFSVGIGLWFYFYMRKQMRKAQERLEKRGRTTLPMEDEEGMDTSQYWEGANFHEECGDR